MKMINDKQFDEVRSCPSGNVLRAAGKTPWWTKGIVALAAAFTAAPTVSGQSETALSTDIPAL